MKDVSAIARSVLECEINGAQSLYNIIDGSFVAICNTIAGASGKVCITGVGKSGNVAIKIASTLSSVGIPSFFLDANNASHGDIGAVQHGDVLIAISNSGEAKELMPIIDFCLLADVKTIAITNNKDSTLSTKSDFSIIIPKLPEASEFGAPTTSTTQVLIVGDMLAMCASHIKNITVIDYANRHPAGSLGLEVTNIMKFAHSPVPMVNIDATFAEATIQMNTESHGFVCIMQNEKLHGIITDGDIRRAIVKGINIESASISDIMIHNPKYAQESNSLREAMYIIQNYRIDVVPIVNDALGVVGYLNRKDFAVWL